MVPATSHDNSSKLLISNVAVLCHSLFLHAAFFLVYNAYPSLYLLMITDSIAVRHPYSSLSIDSFDFMIVPLLNEPMR